MVGLGPLGFAVAVAAYAHAQTTEPIAQCTNTTYQWTFNSRGQSPCLVTSWLGSVCSGGVFNVPPLNLDNVYQGPNLGSDNECVCSSVLYSLISACALCQSANYVRWTAFTRNCTTVYLAFPHDIPDTTSVPHWAYLDVTSSNQFLPVQAEQSRTEAPESTHSSTSATSTSTGPTSTTSASSSSSSNAGPIAGGVIGGIVGLALIAAFVFWWLRRRRPRPPPTLVDPVHGTLDDPLMAPAPTAANNTASFLDTTPSMKLYDPSDPSTFPYPSTTSGTDTAGGSQPYSSQDKLSNPNQHSGAPYATSHGLRYTGAPEV